MADCLKCTLSLHEIFKTDSVKDLGVYVDNKLNFKTHIEDSVVRTEQRSALIFRGFISRNLHHLTFTYISYFLPLLEYASPLVCRYLGMNYNVQNKTRISASTCFHVLMPHQPLSHLSAPTWKPTFPNFLSHPTI